MKKLVLFLPLCLLLSGAAFADEAKGDAVKKDEAVRKYVERELGDSVTKEIYQTAAAAASSEFASSFEGTLGRKLTDAERQKLDAFWGPHIKKLIDKDALVKMLVPVIGKHLNLEEITEINRFYESGPGKKLALLSPLIEKEAESAGEAYVEKAMTEKWLEEVLADLQKQFPDWFKD